MSASLLLCLSRSPAHFLVSGPHQPAFSQPLTGFLSCPNKAGLGRLWGGGDSKVSWLSPVHLQSELITDPQCPQFPSSLMPCPQQPLPSLKSPSPHPAPYLCPVSKNLPLSRPGWDRADPNPLQPGCHVVYQGSPKTTHTFPVFMWPQ